MTGETLFAVGLAEAGGGARLRPPLPLAALDVHGCVGVARRGEADLVALFPGLKVFRLQRG